MAARDADEVPGEYDLLMLDDMADLDPAADTDKKATKEQGSWYTAWDKICSNLAELPITQQLLQGLEHGGATNILPQQLRHGALPLIQGNDMIMLSDRVEYTVCVGVLSKLDFSSSACQALVLCADDERAVNIAKWMEALGVYCQVKVFCTTKAGPKDAAAVLASGVHVVVGRPSRVLFTLLNKARLNSEQVKTVMLCDTDLMLHCSQNRSPLLQIMSPYLGNIPAKRQVGLFLPRKTKLDWLGQYRRFVVDPVLVTVTDPEEQPDIQDTEMA